MKNSALAFSSLLFLYILRYELLSLSTLSKACSLSILSLNPLTRWLAVTATLTSGIYSFLRNIITISIKIYKNTTPPGINSSTLFWYNKSKPAHTILTEGRINMSIVHGSWEARVPKQPMCNEDMKAITSTLQTVTDADTRRNVEKVWLGLIMYEKRMSLKLV